MYINVNTLVKNDPTIEIDNRQTRSRDAVLKIGKLEISFKSGQVKLDIPEGSRENSPAHVANIEQIIHTYIGEPITGPTLQSLAQVLVYDASNLLVYA